MGEQLLEMLPTLVHPTPVLEELAPLLGAWAIAESDIGFDGIEDGDDSLREGEGSNYSSKNSGNSSGLKLASVVTALEEVLRADRALLLPVLAVLFDLPLDGPASAAAAAMVIIPLQIVSFQKDTILVRCLILV